MVKIVYHVEKSKIIDFYNGSHQELRNDEIDDDVRNLVIRLLQLGNDIRTVSINGPFVDTSFLLGPTIDFQADDIGRFYIDGLRKDEGFLYVSFHRTIV